MRIEYLEAFPEDWRQTAQVFSALGDATRQKILLLFQPGEELSIKDISSVFSLGRSTIVHHLSVLQESGVLSVRKQGRLALYSIVYDVILESLEKLRLFIEDDLKILSSQIEKE